MSAIERSIDVNVPVDVAYNQWTQFEEFPRFMEGVEKVVQLDNRRLRWVVEIGGQTREWEAEITEQRPDERIAWAAAGDVSHAGVVTFHRLDDTTTRVMLQMEYRAEGALEKIADLAGITTRRAQGDLERFKVFIESRGSETGAWRGEIPRPDQR